MDKRLYVAKWSWRTEYKIFLVKAYDYDSAFHRARLYVGPGGTIQVEEIVFCNTGKDGKVAEIDL